MRLTVSTVPALEAVPAADWDALEGVGDSPFLCHAFLHGLERHGCVGEAHGWYPRHLLVHDGHGRLVGAMPFYVKTHSYGELVFDWAWAEAYARHGRAYYPKAVATVPYTPVAGSRLLVHPQTDRDAVRRTLSGAAVALAREEGWSGVHALYAALYEHKFGYPTLTRAFFHHLAESLGPRLVLFLAEDGGRIVAVAVCLRDGQVLYGRHWGVAGRYDCLHFELCYYQGIEYCIREGLARFEPGAQGEHKIPRGFLPTPTTSAHWIADPDFSRALARWSAQERAAVGEQRSALMRASPYRRTEDQ